MARSLSVQMLEKTHLMFGLPSKKCMNEHLCMCACAYMKSNLVDRMGGGPRDAPGALQQLDSSRASFSGSGTGGPAARAHIFLASQLPSGQRATLFKNSKGNSEAVCQTASLDTWITCLLAQWELASPISLWRLGPMIDSLPGAPGKAFRRWTHQLDGCQPHVFMHLQIPG